ncbi:MAG TPA: peptidase U32 family protein, partial [Clostridia bacterium]|nr:peptidase U32 family protein [Clostridia bacterium]
MPELVAPAGDMKKLETAIRFGADAVYFGSNFLSLRAFADNFADTDLVRAVEYAHSNGKRAYITVNAFAQNREIDLLCDYFRFLADTCADAAIVADMGVLRVARKSAPTLKLHLSTQANVSNYQSAIAYHEMGIERIVLSREMSLDEIAELRAKTPPSLEIETFVHGAMCLSVSGRCYLSAYLNLRSANRGECTQPCRWSYALKPEGDKESLTAFEDDRGTYILNSRDLNMLKHIPKLIDAGIDAFKIEGRMKTEYYVATVVNAYHKAIDRTASGRFDFDDLEA